MTVYHTYLFGILIKISRTHSSRVSSVSMRIKCPKLDPWCKYEDSTVIIQRQMIYSHCLWTAQWASCNEQSKISPRTLSDAHKCWYSSLWVHLSVFEHFLVKYQGMDKYHDHHSLVWHNLRTLWTCDWPQKNLLIGWLAFAKLPNSISLRLESNGRPIWYSVKNNLATLHFIINFDTRQQCSCDVFLLTAIYGLHLPVNRIRNHQGADEKLRPPVDK